MNFHSTNNNICDINSKRSEVQSDFRQTAKFGGGQLAALAASSSGSPKAQSGDKQFFNLTLSNYNSGAPVQGKFVTPKFTLPGAYQFSTASMGENVASDSPDAGGKRSQSIQ